MSKQRNYEADANRLTELIFEVPGVHNRPLRCHAIIAGLLRERDGEVDRLQAGIKEAEANSALCEEKLDRFEKMYHVVCACNYDDPGAVCMVHERYLNGEIVKQRDEIQRLRAALARAEEQLAGERLHFQQIHAGCHAEREEIEARMAHARDWVRAALSPGWLDSAPASVATALRHAEEILTLPKPSPTDAVKEK